jgi:anti-sigma B factor antagonist
MGITTEELPGGITKVILEGNLDIGGAAAIDLQMNIIAGAHKAVLVDLQKISFIGSMGLRALVSPARAIKNRGGIMVLFGPNAMVEKVLRTSGIDTVIPVAPGRLPGGTADDDQERNRADPGSNRSE